MASNLVELIAYNFDLFLQVTTLSLPIHKLITFLTFLDQLQCFILVGGELRKIAPFIIVILLQDGLNRNFIAVFEVLVHARSIESS